jgi:hypothetical protein
MLTETAWEALAQAVKEETGHYVQWRNSDEMKPSDTMAT